MENAAKALLIAGAVLIAILMLSLFAYLIQKTGQSTSSLYSIISPDEISRFNQKFYKYEGRADLKIQDVITIVNLAIDNNKREKKSTTIKVIINGNDWADVSKTLNQNEKLKSEQEKSYTCTSINTNSTTNLVDEITIIEN